MKTKSPCALTLASMLSLSIALPMDIFAAPQTGGQQRAGEVSRVIPAANIARGSKTITASPKSVVDWLDLVNTQVNGRARVSLDDGSVLNVGSESSMKVEKHDAGAQQTQLELTYGKLRSQAQKIAKPDGKFEVRTPAGVAGVVGTDFYVGYDNSTMNVIVRSGDNSAPLAPFQATLDILTTAVTDTNVGGGAGGLQGVEQVGHHIGKGTAITLGILAAVPAIVFPVVSKGSSQTTPVPPKQGCPPNNPKCG
jgi:hypothetical protein